MIHVPIENSCKLYDFTQINCMEKFILVLGVVHKLRGQDEVGRWSVKCPRLSTKGRWVVSPMSTWTKNQETFKKNSLVQNDY